MKLLIMDPMEFKCIRQLKIAINAAGDQQMKILMDVVPNLNTRISQKANNQISVDRKTA